MEISPEKLLKKKVSIIILATIMITGAILTPIVISLQSNLNINSTGDGQINISVETAYNMTMDRDSYPDLIILDVRTLSEYNDGHINNSILIPHTELESRIGELSGYENREIIVYCRSGFRSNLASQILVNHNFTKVYNLLGGFNAWTGANYSFVM